MLLEVMKRYASVYETKVDPSTTLMLKWTISDTKETCIVQIDQGRVQVLAQTNEEPDVQFSLTSDTFQRIREGTLEAFTAAGKGDIRDPALLDSAFGPTFTMKRLPELYHVLMHFFVTSPIKVVDLDIKQARVVHGAYAIPMFYHEGFRSAWYTVQPGQRLNEPGDTNPFDQAMVILSGSGQATFGNDTFRLEANRAYHIPPGSDHVIDNDTDQPITLIFLAYGPGA